MSIKRIIAFCVVIVNIWWLPVYADQVHRVSPGETLSGIANQYEITTDTLLGHNQYIVDPDLVFPGQVLIIPEANRQYYIVRPGDTLSGISKKFGISVPVLANINDIADWNYIYVGQVLIVPKLYTVKPGDTLNDIAQLLGVDASLLAAENNLADINELYSGQQLIIPYRTPNREELADIENELSGTAARFPGTFFYKGPKNGLRAALTFDDGPDAVATSRVLDLLKKHGVRATFFLLGRNMPGHDEIVKRTVSEGHTVANHTMSHTDLRTLTEEQVYNELTSLENEIYNITGQRTALMRPPYGFVNDDNIRQLSEMGYKVIKWSVDTKDWRDMDIDKVLINTIPNLRDGSIILMHDYLSQSVTLEVLPEIIRSLKSQGYTFVTVDELLGVNPYK